MLPGTQEGIVQKIMDEQRYYILVDKAPKKVSMEEYRLWDQPQGINSPRKLWRTEYGDIQVSTVFLMMDHGWGEGDPVLFETMVFGGALDDEQERYTSYDAAELGHTKMCERVFKSLQGYPHE